MEMSLAPPVAVAEKVIEAHKVGPGDESTDWVEASLAPHNYESGSHVTQHREVIESQGQQQHTATNSTFLRLYNHRLAKLTRDVTFDAIRTLGPSFTS